MFGNGLRPKIWKAFVERFQVKQIGEFYGATEGNSNLSEWSYYYINCNYCRSFECYSILMVTCLCAVNTDNTVGAVGFMPQFAAHLATSLYPVALIKVNEETGEPIRGEDGFCIRCKAGEISFINWKKNFSWSRNYMICWHFFRWNWSNGWQNKSKESCQWLLWLHWQRSLWKEGTLQCFQKRRQGFQ